MTGRRGPVPQHHRLLAFLRTAVASEQTGRQGPSVVARCSCGWRSSFYNRPQFAVASWESHLVDVKS